MEIVAALTIALLITVIIYLLGRSLAPTPPKSRDKLESYACGEKFPPARGPIRLLFFNFAALFMVFDVLALFLAFTINIPAIYKQGLIAIILVYSVVLGLSIHLLGRR
ncbi:MAG: NADH-quinone oxidoreductase subunit A [Thaumarchaeota archaeon]|nr:NADH-quinone oxidoreductase subunit A [Nitrososphaerota archaeon]